MVSVTTISTLFASSMGCDLLEKSYLCGISNNDDAQITLNDRVVICLKSLTFVVSVTTINNNTR